MAHSIWGRLLKLSEIDLGTAVRVAGLLVKAELRSQHSFLSVDELRVLLANSLKSPSKELREQSTHLVETLAAGGFLEYLELLDE